MKKDLNIFLSFPGQATPLTLKNNLRIILGLKPERFKNNEAQQKGRYSYERGLLRFAQMLLLLCACCSDLNDASCFAFTSYLVKVQIIVFYKQLLDY